jgi:hypothetical protein
VGCQYWAFVLVLKCYLIKANREFLMGLKY